MCENIKKFIVVNGGSIYQSTIVKLILPLFLNIICLGRNTHIKKTIFFPRNIIKTIN